MSIHESNQLARINAKYGKDDVFYIVHNEWGIEYYIVSKLKEIEGLPLTTAKEVRSHTFHNVVGYKVRGLVNKWTHVTHTKKGKPRVNPKFVKEVVEGDIIKPIVFKESIDAALYIDEELKEYTSQSGGLTATKSGKFQIIGYNTGDKK